MRVKLTTLLAAVLSLSLASNGQGLPEPSFSLTITAKQTAVKTGTPVIVTLAMTNTTDHNIAMASVAADGTVLRRIRIRVFDSHGKPLLPNEHGKKVHAEPSQGAPPPFNTVVSFPVHPGKSLEEDADLSKEFDLSKPGTYTASAEMRLGGESVQSKTVTFTVIP